MVCFLVGDFSRKRKRKVVGSWESLATVLVEERKRKEVDFYWVRKPKWRLVFYLFKGECRDCFQSKKEGSLGVSPGEGW